MPAGDKTGPNGQGAMTGRGLGRCSGNEYMGNFNNFRKRNNGCKKGGRGLGRGFAQRGQGFGFGRFSNNEIDQKSFLENEKEILQNQINDLQKRIDGLEE